MNMVQIARLILTGTMQEIPEQSRLDIIRLILSVRKRAVEYLPNATICPVCDYFGMAGDVRITSTRDAVRSCWCRRCTATFTAIGEELPPPEPKGKPEPKSRKKKRKR